MHGTIIMRCKLDRAVMPIFKRNAYENAPATPANPVPDDQVDITFLQNENQLDDCVKLCVAWATTLYEIRTC